MTPLNIRLLKFMIITSHWYLDQTMKNSKEYVFVIYIHRIEN